MKPINHFSESYGISLPTWLDPTIGFLGFLIGLFALMAEVWRWIEYYQGRFQEKLQSLENKKNAATNKENDLRYQYDIIRDAITANGSSNEQLSVVAPAGKWLNTSSWSEIVAKMAAMLQTHKWGEIPSLMDLNYVIEIDGQSETQHRIGSEEFRDNTEFVQVNYLEWHGFNWEGATSQRTSLTAIISQLLTVYVVMPLEDFASVRLRNSTITEAVPAYPINRDMIARWIKLRDGQEDAEHDEDNRAHVLNELRKISWLGPCRRELVQNSRADNQSTLSEATKENLEDYENKAYHHRRVLGNPAFTVKLLFKGNGGAFNSCKVRYVSLFNTESGKENKNVKEVISLYLGASDIEEEICKYNFNVVGCYVPVPADIDNLKKVCGQIQAAQKWENLHIRLVYSWSYLHVRRIESTTDVYFNNTWNFPVASVGNLIKAEFRARGNIRFQDENSVLTYFMTEPAQLPKLDSVDKILFQPGGLSTCPSDSFHISWESPEIDNLLKENQRLREQIKQFCDEKKASSTLSDTE